MSTALNGHIYPYTENVRKLPVFLTGIGGTEYQEHVVRGTEACWDQFLICLKGEGRLLLDGDSFELEPGDIFFVPRKIPHEYFSVGEKWETRWVVFDGADIEGLQTELGLTEPVVLKNRGQKELLKLFDRMFVTLRTEGLYGNFICSGLCYQFIMEFHRLLSGTGGMTSGVLLPVLNYIENNFRHDLPVTEIAAASGVSQQYLGRLFRRELDTTIERYIQDRRIWEAKTLLRETDKDISEIAAVCGFSSSGYFSTVFRRVIGLSPKKYRSSIKD